jgi:hypothetical protein
MSSDAANAYVRAEVQRWTNVIRENKIQPER